MPDRGAVYYLGTGTIACWQDVGIVLASPYYRHACPPVIPDMLFAEYVFRLELRDLLSELRYPDYDRLRGIIANMSKDFVVDCAMYDVTRPNVPSSRVRVSYVPYLLYYSPHWKACMDVIVQFPERSRNIIERHNMPYHILEYGLSRTTLDTGILVNILWDINLDLDQIRGLIIAHQSANPNTCDLRMIQSFRHVKKERMRVLFEVVGADAASRVIGEDQRSAHMYVEVFGLASLKKYVAANPSALNGTMYLLDASDIDYARIRDKVRCAKRMVGLDRVDMLRALVTAAKYTPNKALVDHAIKCNSEKCLAYLLGLQDWGLDLNDYLDKYVHAEVINLLVAAAK